MEPGPRNRSCKTTVTTIELGFLLDPHIRSVSISQTSVQAKNSRFRIGMSLLVAASTLALIWVLWRGWGYYWTPLEERPRHVDYGLLRPAGDLSHGLGILGSLMMVALLGYSLRKRWRILRRAGSVSRWLSVHIYLGIFGPILVILHSSFKVGGLVAVSFWSMVAVAVSGVLGRYLYKQIPRNLQGDTLSLEALSKADEMLADDLRSNFAFTTADLEALRTLASGPSTATGGLGRALLQSLFGDLMLPLRLRRWLQARGGSEALPRARRRRLLDLARRKALLERRMLLLERLGRIFHYWHVIHKPFAIIMLAIMIVHVTVALLLGYRWLI